MIAIAVPGVAHPVDARQALGDVVDVI